MTISDGNNRNLFVQILKYRSLCAGKAYGRRNNNRKFSVSPSNFRRYKFYWFIFARMCTVTNVAI